MPHTSHQQQFPKSFAGKQTQLPADAAMHLNGFEAKGENETGEEPQPFPTPAGAK